MDKEQNKWRGRGRGNVSVYYNKLTVTAKLIFNDEKHNKTRLLQCIHGGDKCVFINDLNAEVSAVIHRHWFDHFSIISEVLCIM